MIDFTGICKSYGKQDLFNNVSFRINPGERVGIVGPNGMGKTTLFQILTGEISPDRGEVSIPKKTISSFLATPSFVAAADAPIWKAVITNPLCRASKSWQTYLTIQKCFVDMALPPR